MPKVLITGGAGFIGSHLTDLLIANGYNVYIIDNLSTGNTSNVNKSAKLYQYDICSLFALEHVFSDCMPDFVVHMAAQNSVEVSSCNPILDAEINILGTLNVLQCCEKYNVRRIIYTSTAAVYGNNPTVPLSEEEVCTPISNYGFSKLAAEEYIKLQANELGLTYSILRFANVYGPRQQYVQSSGVIPIFINKLLNNENISIFGDGNQTRDFIYVMDIVRAIYQCIELTTSKVYNVSSGQETSLKELILILNQILKRDIQPEYTAGRTGDIYRSVLCNKRIQKEVGWLPIVSLNEGLIETLAYYRQMIGEREELFT